MVRALMSPRRTRHCLQLVSNRNLTTGDGIGKLPRAIEIGGFGVSSNFRGNSVRAYSDRHGRLRFTFNIDRRARGADGFSGDINPASGIKRECIGISGGKSRRAKSRRS